MYARACLCAKEEIPLQLFLTTPLTYFKIRNSEQAAAPELYFKCLSLFGKMEELLSKMSCSGWISYPTSGHRNILRWIGFTFA